MNVKAPTDLFPLLVSSVIDYAIFALDPNGYVLTWNEGAQRIKGYTASEIIGQHFSVFYPQEAKDSGFPAAELVLADTEGRWEDEGWRIRKDGTRFWANVIITALRDKTGTLVGYAKVTRDMTERRAAEEERLRLVTRERAAKAATAAAQQALALREEFLSVAAHELKTPLTSLRGFAQVLLRALDRSGVIDPDRLRQSLQAIDDQSNRMKRLIEQLLDVTRLQEGRLQLEAAPADLAAVTRHAVVATRARDEEHEIRIDTPEEFPAIVDEGRYEQVLLNLLDNALKFSPGGTSIEVALSAPRPGWARLVVRDHGVGIPTERRVQIFERFFQAHADSFRSGLGLGLYIVQRIVDMHGGHVEMTFPEDGGTRVSVDLPVEPVETGASAVADVQPAGRAAG